VSAYHKNALHMGYQLAEYRIDSVLGYGGFGITYLAHDTTLNAQVAIKEFLPHTIAVRDDKTGNVMPKPDRDAVRDYHWGLKNFVKEARALAQFKHPNIVRVLRFLEANGTAYMVMEYEKGESLAQYLKSNGPRLDEAMLLRIFIPILNGLHAVHEANMLHLDIKPENIYLRTDGSPMLIDFGSARQAIVGSGHVQRVALTHGYAPLEQYPDKGKQGPWTDIYAIGATMYRCVCGKQPDDSLERNQAILKYKVDPLMPATKAAKKYYRENVLECIDWAMQIYSNDRPQSARLFQDALMGKGRQVRNQAPVSAPAKFRTSTHESNAIPRASSYRAPPATGRHSKGGWLAFLLVAVIAAAAFYFWPVEQAWRFPEPARREPVRSTSKTTADNQATAGTDATRTGMSAKMPPVTTKGSSLAPTSEVMTLAGHTDWITSLAFSADGQWIASGSGDMTVKVWEMPGGKLIGTLRGHGYAINSVAVSSDNKWIASAGNDGTVRLWDVRTGKQHGALQGQGYSLFAVAFSPDGKQVAAAGRDRSVFVWEADSGKRIYTLEGHTADINALAYSADGKSLISGGADRTLYVWDMTNGQALNKLSGHKEGILALAMSRNGEWLASGDAGNTIRVWDASDYRHARTLTDIPHSILSLAFSPDGKWLAVGAANKTLRIFDVAAGTLAHSVEGHQDFVNAVAFSPDGQWLVSGSRDRQIRVWGTKK
jgi:serine/threonine protein kinase